MDDRNRRLKKCLDVCTRYYKICQFVEFFRELLRKNVSYWMDTTSNVSWTGEQEMLGFWDFGMNVSLVCRDF
jgi:hypothetical protein